MFLIRKTARLSIIVLVILSASYLVSAQAEVMDFDTPPMRAAVFGNFGEPDFYTQNGLEHTSIDFENGGESSHIHGVTVNDSRVSQLAGDAGGAIFRAATRDKFSFQSLDLVTLDLAQIGGGESTFHVVGMRDGIKVADIVLTKESIGTTVNFLERNENFGHVDQVEYWFTPPGRANDPADPEFQQKLFNLKVEIDNVNFDLQPTAVPAVTLSISSSENSYATGSSLKLDIAASSPGGQSVVDMYMLIVLPDGNNLISFTDLDGQLAFGHLSNLAAVPPMIASLDASESLAINLPAFFTFDWTGQEPIGEYSAYLVMLKAGALSDGNLEQGDILQVSQTNFSFAP